MSFDGQNYGSRRPRRDSYDASPVRGRRNDSPRIEDRYRRPTYRDDDRSRYRDSENRRGPPPRRHFENRRGEGPPNRRNEQTKPCKVLGVFGLSTNIKERDLHDIFSAYGKVVDIRMVYDNMSGRSRGFGFVYYDSLEDARNAMSSCEGGLDIDGKLARVDYSLTSGPHNPTPGVYLGKRKRDGSRDCFRRRSGGDDRHPRSRNSSRYSGSRTASRDRSPVRSRYPPRSRRRTVSSSRSPPPYNVTRNGIPDRKMELEDSRVGVWPGV
ncbi:hypothetical protein ACTXT7_001992 [Hymenolepis weldensis]